MGESLEVEKKEAVEVESSGEMMISGISLTNWGLVIGKLIVLYIFLTGWFTALFYCGMEVRGTDYLRLPSKYFGDFDRNKGFESIYTISQHRDPILVENNRPTGCVTSVGFGGDNIQCDSDDNGLWNVFPWVSSNKIALGMNAQCFTSRAVDFVANEDMTTLVCSNYVADGTWTGFPG
ncbi:hypothetical protein HOP50_01g01040 [Chloropicon primus]|uniref:Uncharacterized protein n=1 Tax=Chloropicon primus TaxID=1764295 RepID=A0A5B8MDA2_9CHLO|nr:hypothetical protein A3770_01p01130 [Chloropicon primus]UPQ96813.1 hypothetical protein HOP50_01g01040 [Chloropicon primus]|mmetsp:Transcript_1710/g.4756  ORF Transcript_1710/g.4756 Transcript_1710/m.4756 type:complete len:178 (+) Transcript_1710:260-793(+)|eukprot:QDZ17595.1 hypothetical protein A3770_01p01130 [Chloropicon primus]